jgi:hypothetical protein
VRFIFACLLLSRCVSRGTQDSNGIPDLSWADRLYRYSQRYIGRFEKWDRRLGQYTYGQVTLYQAYLKRYLQFSLSLR